MKIFITGASGYVGCKLLTSLGDKEKGHQLVACDILERGGNDTDDSRVEWFSAEGVSRELLKDKMTGCSCVVHLAQSPFYRDFPERAEDIFDTNVRFVLQLLDIARECGVTSFLLFSSGGVYGSGSSFHELDRLNPLDFYLASKGMSELIARKYREFMKVHIIRPFFIYGPGQRDKLIVNLIERIQQNKVVFLNGTSGGGTLNPVFIDDVINMTELLTREDVPGSCTVNFAGPDYVSLESIIKLCGELLNTKPIVEFKDGEALDMSADIVRINELFPKLELTGIEDGLHKTVESMS